ncbi:MAG: DNA repair protein RadA [Lactobacillales bacterium]|jgi:DNA repair protein RadA/Sms|nr:DNA repair protein RadA [Lactobacillales bacterium]
MAKVKTQFVCTNCEYVYPKYLGRCPNCGEWGTLVEREIEDESAPASTKAKARTRMSLDGEKNVPVKISEVGQQHVHRVKSEMNELNRVLGGGVVPGSLVLIGGDPGIGKSTLLLQLSNQLANIGGNVLYVSGEESAEQIKMRAERLNAGEETDFYLFAQTDMRAITKAISELKPDFVIIDSIQTMSHPEIESAVGSVSQVRETTAALMQIAKSNGIAIFIVGHVTKEGSIAGPRMLEHMVDTVLYFEGERHHTFRILRAVKNRFGSTNEIGIFEMNERGLEEVLNPSMVFLGERLAGANGSAIVVALEGTRPILVELQALLVPAMFGNAKRTTTGVDKNRASVIMAVLEKRAGIMLQTQDAYLKAAGGVRLAEPAIDMALAVAIASSYHEKETPHNECYVGELGLTGEIRRVTHIEQRVNEAAKLGFKRIYIPKNNFGGWTVPPEIEVIGIETIKELLVKLF